MARLEFPLLREDQIEVRVGMDNGKGCSLLLYKDARCDMAILDEVIGPENWQRKHYECKGNLFCSVGIRFPDGWTWKDDCGAESNVEKEKGEASDSFKRACFCWGIGRELYTAPFLWVTNPERNDKGKLTDSFYVEKIAYDDQRKICGIAIRSRKTDRRVIVWQR